MGETIEIEEKVLVCKACGYPVSKNYCSSCGQRYISNRITLRESLSVLIQSILSLDKGLWYTSFHLVVRPHVVIKNYLNGITLKYSNPFRYLFIWLTISVFVFYASGYIEYINEMFNVNSNKEPQVLQDMMALYYSYINVFISISMPFLALGTKWFFKKGALNFAEHLVIVAYAYGTFQLISLLMIPIYMLFPDYTQLISSIMFVASFVFITYFYSMIFKGNIILTFLKMIGSFFIWLIGFILMLMPLAFLYIYMRIQQDPSVVEQFTK